MTTLELILPPLLAIGGGVIGYFYRESQNRSKPFMTFGKIEELRNNQDDITIPEHIIDTLRNNFYAKELYPKMKVKDFYSTWDRCDDFRRFSEDAINKLHEIVHSTSIEELKNNVKIFFSKTFEENTIFIYLLNKKLNIDKYEETDVIIPYTFSPASGKEDIAVYFHFDDTAYGVGKKLDDESIKFKCEPFIKLISYLPIQPTKNFFKEVIKDFENERSKILSVITEIDQLKENISRWTFYFSIINLSKSPLSLFPNATIEVKSRAANPKPFECYLTTQDSYQGQSYLKDADYPLSLLPGQQKTVAWLSNSREMDIEDGELIRTIYKQGDAKFRVRIHIRRPGFFSENHYQTEWFAFKPN